MQLCVLFVGLVMAAATLLTIDLKLAGGLIPGSGGLAVARTAGFTMLVLAQLFKCLNSRSERECLPRHIREPSAVGRDRRLARAAGARRPCAALQRRRSPQRRYRRATGL